MDLLIAVISGFVLAVFTPWLHRLLGDRVGYVVALLPLGVVIHFSRYVGQIASNDAIAVSYRWVPGMDLSLSLYLDGLSLLFVLLISGIGVLVSIYASGYLHGHPQLGIFYSYLLVFLAAMLGTVLAGNVLTLYVFWELTTLSSYLLVGFEHEREAARNAAQQALIVTAMGGLAMLAGLILLGLAAGSFEFAAMLQQGDAVRGHSTYFAILALILLGAFTKSAQFPFYFWLPNAMQAPTPVSAYLHSATMVKAGVFLLARLSPVLGGTWNWSVLVTGVGAVTMLVGASLAFYERDLKGILAYLTVNVLGTLVMLLGIGTPLAVKAAVTYLFAHALYKAAMFLSAGIVDHATHTRDVTELGGLLRKLPVTGIVVILAALSMAGVVPLFGFVAKELLLESVWTSSWGGLLLTPVTVVASLFVVLGACMVSVKPFFGSLTSHAESAHEPGVSLWGGPVLLAVASLVVGILPETLATPLIGPAASAIRGEAVTVHLALWHGITIPLLLSLTVLGVGGWMYVARENVRRWLPGGTWGKLPEWAYLQTMAGINWFALKQARALQHGLLRRYISTLITVMVGLVLITMLRVDFVLPQHRSLGVQLHEGIIVLLIFSATLMAVRTTSRMGAIAALGVVGFSIAWLFYLFGAPDLAMTQIVTEALTVVLFALAILHLPRFTIQSDRRTRIQDAALAIGAGVLMTVLVLLVTTGSDVSEVSQYYAENSAASAHGRNIVNVILVDFRALDTLGEITVLSAAAVGVAALLRISQKGKAA